MGGGVHSHPRWVKVWVKNTLGGQGLKSIKALENFNRTDLLHGILFFQGRPGARFKFWGDGRVEDFACATLPTTSLDFQAKV